jgi:hypothetical protein
MREQYTTWQHLCSCFLSSQLNGEILLCLRRMSGRHPCRAVSGLAVCHNCEKMRSLIIICIFSDYRRSFIITPQEPQTNRFLILLCVIALNSTLLSVFLAPLFWNQIFLRFSGTSLTVKSIGLLTVNMSPSTNKLDPKEMLSFHLLFSSHVQYFTELYFTVRYLQNTDTCIGVCVFTYLLVFTVVSHVDTMCIPI